MIKTHLSIINYLLFHYSWVCYKCKGKCICSKCINNTNSSITRLNCTIRQFKEIDKKTNINNNKKIFTNVKKKSLFRCLCDICHLIIESKDDIKFFDSLSSFLEYIEYALSFYKTILYSKNKKSLLSLRRQICELKKKVESLKNIEHNICKGCILRIVNSDNFIQLSKSIFNNDSVMISPIEKPILTQSVMPKPKEIIKESNIFTDKLNIICSIGDKLIFHFKQMNDSFAYLNKNKEKINKEKTLKQYIQTVNQLSTLNYYGFEYLTMEFEKLYSKINYVFYYLSIKPNRTVEDEKSKNEIGEIRQESMIHLENMKSLHFLFTRISQQYYLAISGLKY